MTDKNRANTFCYSPSNRLPSGTQRDASLAGVPRFSLRASYRDTSDPRELPACVTNSSQLNGIADLLVAQRAHISYGGRS